MAQIGTIKVQGPSGPVSIPVYDVSDPSNNFLRVDASGTTAAIALESPSSAAFPYLRVDTPSGVLAVTEVSGFEAGQEFVTLDTEAQWADSIISETGYVLDGISDHVDWETLQQGLDFGSITEGLVGYYPFDDNEDNTTAIDESIGGNNGTINGATYNGTGQVGSNCLDFDGTDDYVVLGRVLDDPDDEFAVSFWFNADTFSGGDNTLKRLIAKYPGNGTPNGYFTINTDGASSPNLRVGISDNASGSQSFDSTQTFNTSEWYHICVTFDAGELRFYIDGFLDSTHTSAAPTLDLYEQNWSVGEDDPPTNDEFFDGQIDDVRIFNRNLSDEEVIALSEKTTTSTVQFGDTL